MASDVFLFIVIANVIVYYFRFFFGLLAIRIGDRQMVHDCDVNLGSRSELVVLENIEEFVEAGKAVDWFVINQGFVQHRSNSVSGGAV